MYQQIVDFENLHQAYLEARRGKRYRPEVARYSAALEERLINLHNHLVHQTWRPGPAREFVVLEPKMRHIQAPPFEDRIVHHAIYRVVEPLFERRFIHHSYACRTGKGVHAAIRALQSALRTARRRWGSPWVLHADVSRFFPSLPHWAVIDAVKRAIPCAETVNLWRVVLAGYGHEDGIGVPVGALTSQLAANAALDGVDHEMTDEHGASPYLRYMDDIIIISPTKAASGERMEQLAAALASRGLALNPKTQVRPASAGVDWCGYRTWSTHILPRRRNMRRWRQRFQSLDRLYAQGRIDLSAIREKVLSMRAYTRHCRADRTSQSILNTLSLRRHYATD